MVKYQRKKDYFPFVNVSARAIKKSIVQKKNGFCHLIPRHSIIIHSTMLTDNNNHSFLNTFYSIAVSIV